MAIIEAITTTIGQFCLKARLNANKKIVKSNKKHDETKGEKKIIPDWSKHVGMKKIKKALENNIGTYISVKNICYYSHEIENFLEESDLNTSEN